MVRYWDHISRSLYQGLSSISLVKSRATLRTRFAGRSVTALAMASAAISGWAAHFDGPALATGSAGSMTIDTACPAPAAIPTEARDPAVLKNWRRLKLPMRRSGSRLAVSLHGRLNAGSGCGQVLRIH